MQSFCWPIGFSEQFMLRIIKKPVKDLFFEPNIL